MAFASALQALDVAKFCAIAYIADFGKGETRHKAVQPKSAKKIRGYPPPPDLRARKSSQKATAKAAESSDFSLQKRAASAV
ncbi:hypothetical protein BA723_08150 [Helicobacter sp. CLO-3]|nr:hypothetical protein BA723_08150 [Helicobacter sp. CLO-3]